MGMFQKIFGTGTEKEIKDLKALAEKVKAQEEGILVLSKEQLMESAKELRIAAQQGESLDVLLPEAFSLVREISKRVLGQRHFDAQVMGGVVLHQGKIAEMKTGEGKTLTATLPVFLNALEGKGVHVVTVNDYLAKRDAVWMGQIYYALGLSVGCIIHDQSFLYDPLYIQKDNSQEHKILNSQFVISNQAQGLGDQDPERDKERDVFGSFKVEDSYLRPVSRKEAYLADITYGTNNEFGFDYLRDNMVQDLSHRSQRGHHFAVVDEIDSILIDEARTPLIISAPDQESSSWYQEFSHVVPQLIKDIDYELDEKLKAVSLTEEGINKIERITGTKDIYEEKGIKFLHHLEEALKAEALFYLDRDYVVRDGQVVIVDEFTGRMLPGRRYSGGLHQALEAKEKVRIQPESITLASVTFQNYFRMYKKLSGMTGTALTSAEEFSKVYNLEVVPVPTNKPMIRKDTPDRIYQTDKAKFKAVVQEIRERHENGQPVLVGTVSIQKNEYLSALLHREGIAHEVLNAKFHEKEGAIIAQAGRKGAVTVATNMAGRGVDIILGGNPPSPEESRGVREVGGLHIIGTERHEARRIDNQLRGRSGRQGDPGSSVFFVSLEDDLARIFGGDRIKGIMKTMKVPEDEVIESGIVSKSIESAQSKIEGFNFDSRKHLLEYDDVLNKHRETIYRRRREILEKNKITMRSFILEIVKKIGHEETEYVAKERELGEEQTFLFSCAVALRALDTLWVEHLENMEALRDSVRLRAYGQQDPLVEYKNEGRQMFGQLLENIEQLIVHMFFEVQQQASPMIAVQAQPVQDVQYANVGRNDPCPCGAINPEGRPIKYKHCHGA